jgi:hypothetical protein
LYEGLCNKVLSSRSREGTFQGEAVGAAMFAARAFEPLQVLTMPDQDRLVARHAARTLAELARVTMPVSFGVGRFVVP